MMTHPGLPGSELSTHPGPEVRSARVAATNPSGLLSYLESAASKLMRGRRFHYKRLHTIRQGNLPQKTLPRNKFALNICVICTQNQFFH